MYLPANMTDELQPMDVVVNATLKAHLRKLRIKFLLNYFESFREQMLNYQRLKNEIPNLLVPVYEPPKPTYKDAVVAMLDIMNTKLKEESFKNSLRKCFIEVGIAPDPEHDNKFWNYVSKKSGVLDLDNKLTEDDCVAGWCIDLQKRPKDDDYVDLTKNIDSDDEEDDDDDDDDNELVEGEEEDNDDIANIEETEANIMNVVEEEKTEDEILVEEKEERANYTMITSNDNNKRIRRPNSRLSEISASVYCDTGHRWKNKSIILYILINILSS